MGLCGGSSTPSDEHFLQRGFGKFRGNTKLKDRVCTDCNNHLSGIDEVLLRSSPPALMRVAHDIRGREEHRSTDLFHARSHGHPPIELEALLPNDDSSTRLEVLGGGLAQPRRELIFESGGEPIIVPIPHSVTTVDALNKHLEKYGVLGRTWPRIQVNCPADDSDFIAIIEERYGKISSDHAEPNWTGYPANVRTTTLFKLSAEYYRAIAKIAFHFFLSCFSPPLSGLECGFDDLKRFIYRGEGQPERFMRCGFGPVASDLHAVPWAHVLAAVWTGRDMAASVQLFSGSNSGMSVVAGDKAGKTFQGSMKDNGLIWTVSLGQTALFYPPQRKAVVFLGYDHPKDGFNGEVRELRPTDGSNGHFWSMR